MGDFEVAIRACAAKTSDREKYLNFTQPYLSFPLVIITQENAPFIGGLKDLNGKRVSIIKRVSTLEWLRRDQIEIIPHFVNTPLDALKAVSLGHADADIENLAAASYLFEKEGLANLKVAAPTPYENYKLYMAIRKDWSELVTIINKALDAMTPEEHAAIRNKWLSVRYEYGISSLDVMKWLLVVSIPALIVILLILFWNRKLNKEVFERKNAEKELKEREYWLSKSQSVAQIGSFTFDVNTGKWTSTNVLDDILGIDGSYDKNTEGWGKTIHPEDRKEMLDYFKTILKRIIDFNKEYRIIRRSDKQQRWVQGRGEPILNENGKLQKLIGTIQDITERKLAEEAVQVAKEQAERANRAKSTFLANMSHELRTPLNAILGFSQMMVHNQDLTPDQKENIQMINNSGEHLFNLINDILDMAKIEAGRIILNETDFNLYHLLDDVMVMFKIRTEEKGLKMKFEQEKDVPQYVRTDEAKLRQVLTNLLSNAVKFTQKGSVVLRAARGTPVPSDPQFVTQLHFEIEDTGPGMAQEELENIFEAFIQTQTGVDSREGTGLGLQISRKFIQLMGGTISVDSKEKAGTVFKFDIQALIREHADAETEEPGSRVIALAPNQEGRPPRYRILVVDDIESNRRVLLKLLSPIGFELRDARNGEEAIEIWEAWRPHLIWLDIRMPGMDGYEVTRSIREAEGKSQEVDGSGLQTQDSRVKSIIIAISASVFEDKKTEALSAGCDDFVAKPFKETEIFEKMQKHLDVRYVREGAGTPEQWAANKTASAYRFRNAAQDGTSEAIEPEQQILTSGAMKDIPSEWKTKMKRAIQQVDLDQIQVLIGQIREQDAFFADTIQKRIDQFDYEKVLEVLG